MDIVYSEWHKVILQRNVYRFLIEPGSAMKKPASVIGVSTKLGAAIPERVPYLDSSFDVY